MTATFTLATDPTHGLYVSSLTTALGTSAYLAEPMFRVHVFSTTPSMTEVTSASGWYITTDTVGNVTTVTAILLADASVWFTFTITAEADGLAYGDWNFRASATRSIAAFTMRDKLTHASVGESSEDDWYVGHNYTSGHTLRSPNKVGSSSLHGPTGCQFASYWGVNTRLHNYLWWDDVESQPIISAFIGDGTACTRSFTLLSDRWFTANHAWTRSFKVRRELFVGQAIDGTREGKEAALRYAAWADGAGRPWNADGPWRSDATIDPTLFGLEMFVSGYGKETTRVATDFTKWATVLGFSHMAYQAGGWKHNDPGSYELLQEAFTPSVTEAGAIRSGTISMIGALQGVGCAFVPYFGPREFDSRAQAGYRYNGFNVAGLGITDISAYMLKKSDGSIRVTPIASEYEGPYGAGDYRNLDFGQQPVTLPQLLAAQIATDYLSLTAPSPFWWMYIDALDGSVLDFPSNSDLAGSIPTEYNHDPAATGWTYALFVAGKIAYSKAIQDTLKLAHGSNRGAVVSEWPLQAAIGNGRRMQPLKEKWSNQGNPSHFLQVVHGERTRFISYDYGFVETTDLLVSVAYTSRINDAWHSTCGVICWQDDLDDLAGAGEIFGADLDTSSAYYFAKWHEKLRLANTMCRPYWEGRMYRDLCPDWQQYRNEQLQASALIDWRQLPSTESVFRSSTHRHRDGDKLGIICTYAFPAAATLRPADVGGLTPYLQAAKTKTITINSIRDELPAGPKGVFVTVDGGTRTLLAEFEEEITFERTFEPWTVTLIEVQSLVFVDETTGDDTTGVGTLAAPYQSIQKGLDEAGHGAVVKVLPGVYDEEVTVPALDNLRIERYGAGRVIVNGFITAAGTWTKDGATDRWYLSLATDPLSIAFELTGGGRTKGLRHTSAAAVNATGRFYYDAVADRLYVYSPAGNPATAFASVKLCSRQYGIEADGVDGLTIEGIECEGQQDACFYLHTCDALTLRDVVAGYGAGSGIYAFAVNDALIDRAWALANGQQRAVIAPPGDGIFIAGTSTGVIRACRATDNLKTGIWIQGFSSFTIECNRAERNYGNIANYADAAGTFQTIQNNQVVMAADDAGGIASNADSDIYGNTVLGASVAAGVGIQLDATGSTPTIEIQNNIVTRTLIGIYRVGGTTSERSNGLGGNGSAAVGLTPDASDVLTDPQLRDMAAGDLRLKAASPARGVGTDLIADGVTADFDGRPRPAAPDIGALQFVPPGGGVLAASGELTTTL